MSSESSPNDAGQFEYDPVFLHSRKEAIIIFCVWLAAFAWVVPYCYFNGYIRDFDPQNINTIWGIPSWAFWGILAPWLVADVFTTWFCFFYMADDDLGEGREGEGEDVAEQHASQKESNA